MDLFSKTKKEYCCGVSSGGISLAVCMGLSISERAMGGELVQVPN